MTLRTDILAMLADRENIVPWCVRARLIHALIDNPPLTFSTPEQCAHARKVADKVKSLTGACERRLRWESEQPGQHSAVKIAAHLAIAEAKVAEDWAELQELTKGSSNVR